MLTNSKVGSYTCPAQGAASVRPHTPSVVAGSTLLYDANGNMTSGLGRTITPEPSPATPETSSM
ncbi:hypothetical protein [Chthonobacter albigriseus]|uniref:hypothetical protein n=1 Tax=Chthonobacter albigriseus TaxID=1683161 RepID=UPI001FCEC31C|nr:hypothetical protein [Chthonobacter albigriseus]